MTKKPPPYSDHPLLLQQPVGNQTPASWSWDGGDSIPDGIALGMKVDDIVFSYRDGRTIMRTVVSVSPTGASLTSAAPVRITWFARLVAWLSRWLP